MTRPKLRIVVLAAGFSTRLGEPKPLARVRGKSLIKRTIRALAPLAASPIIVVLAPRAMRTLAELRGEPITIVVNFERAMGLSSSVRRGLAASSVQRGGVAGAGRFGAPQAAGLRALDLALERCAAARRRRTFRRTRRCTAHLAALALLTGAWYPGDHGLKKLVSQLPGTDRVLVHIPAAAWDVDTPQDLERARSQARPRPSH